jgi:hypothetical protein
MVYKQKGNEKWKGGKWKGGMIDDSEYKTNLWMMLEFLYTRTPECYSARTDELLICTFVYNPERYKVTMECCVDFLDYKARCVVNNQ